MTAEATLSTGIFAARRYPQSAPSPAPVELFGHVVHVERNALTNFDGAHALVQLCNSPGGTVAVLTAQLRLQSLLQSALSSGNLIAFQGTRLAIPPAPRSGAWAVNVYTLDGVTLYSTP
jgi:hypothetical protein